MAVSEEKRRPVFDRLNDGGVGNCEVEEGLSKMKGGKAPWLD